MQLFISYSHDDKAYVRTLANELSNEYSKHSVFVDTDLKGGQDWWQKIISEIEKCDCFICILTPASNKSIYCANELKYAVDLNKAILPLKLKPCDIPEIISDKQCESIFELAPENIIRLCLSALGELHAEVARGNHNPPSPRPKRPMLPRGTKTPHAGELINIESQILELNTHTYRIYSRWLVKFLRESSDQFTDIVNLRNIGLIDLLQTLTPTNVAEWLHTIASHKSRSSGSQARAAVLWLAHMLFEPGYLDDTKIALIKNAPLPSFPKEQKNEKVWLDQNQLRSLIEAANLGTLSNRPISYRDRAVIYLLATLGLSRSELIGLVWNDIWIDQETMKSELYVGRFTNSRMIPVPHPTSMALSMWKKHHPNPEGRNHIFTRILKGDVPTTLAISDKSIWNIVNYVSARTGLTSITPDVIRRSFARNAYDFGVAIEDIKDMLGHQSLATTEKFIAYSRTKKVSLNLWVESLNDLTPTPSEAID